MNISSCLRTDNDQELDKIFVRGMGWTAGVKWLTQALTWGTTIVVARMLAPSDYGLVGMATVFISLFSLFSEFGIGTAVVTLQDLTEDQISQLNTLGLVVGLIGFLVGTAASIPLGKFFHAPKLPLVVIFLSFGFVVSGIRTVPYSLLQRDLQFKLLAFIEGLQGMLQALITLALAWMGFGYWALVAGIVSFSITPTLLTLFFRRQSFVLPRLSSIRRSLHYSRHILIGRLSWAAYDNSDFIIAGRALGEASLGAYTLAWTLAHTPLEKLAALVNRVTPSVFATIQTNPDALRRYLRNITSVIAAVIFPATIGIAMVAPEFVPLILGPKWSGVIIPLELLALHALIRSLIILLIPVLNVIGEERLVMWNSIVAMIVLPLSFYIGSHWGTTGIAAAWVLIYPAVHLPLLSRVFRKLHFPIYEYFRALWPAISGCLVMVLCIEFLRLVLSNELPLSARLCLEIVTGIFSYGLVLFVLHRNYVHAILQFVKTYRRT